MSADPLEIHGAGESGELNVYAYVSGRALQSVDPLGLQESDSRDAGAPGGTPDPNSPDASASYEAPREPSSGGNAGDGTDLEEAKVLGRQALWNLMTYGIEGAELLGTGIAYTFCGCGADKINQLRQYQQQRRQNANDGFDQMRMSGRTSSGSRATPKPAATGGGTPKPKLPSGTAQAPARGWKSTQTGTTGGNSTILRKNLGMKDGDGGYAHHIVPSTSKYINAERARKLLDRYQIDINDAANGANLSKQQHYGQRLHSHRGMDRVFQQLKAAEGRGGSWGDKRKEIVTALRETRVMIESGSLVK